MESKHVDARQGFAGPVHYLDFGGEGPPVVMIHGLGGNALNWMAVGPRFAERHRVYALDLPGFGMSPVSAWQDGSVSASARVVNQFVRRVVNGPALLMGNSMGGMVALMASANEPHLSSGLVLVDPSQPLRVGMPVDLGVAKRFATYALPWFGSRHMRSWAKQRGPRGLVEDMLQLCCRDMGRIPPHVVEAHVAHLTERIASGVYSEKPFLTAAKSLLRLILRPGAFEAATKTSVPTLLCSGTHDRLVPLYLSKALARSRPDWTLEVFEDSGHVPMLEHADEFHRRVQGWIDRRLGRIPKAG